MRWHVPPRRNADVVPDTLGPFASLVQLAVGSDDPAKLIAAAGCELRRPLGLVDATGEALAHAPDDDEGRRALAIARAAARHQLVAPPGWHIVLLGRGPLRLGFLAIGHQDRPDTLLDLLPALLTDQLQRAALLRGRRAAFVRELVTDPQLGPDHARREAAELGLRLADAYWPALLVWRNVPPSAELVETVERSARTRAEGALTARLEGHVILLLPATASAAAPGAWFEDVVREARTLAPASRAQAIVGEGPAALGTLSVHVAELEDFLRFGARADEDRLVAAAGQFALDRLLWDNVDARAAAAFVEARLGTLIAWDRRHGTSLVTLLEASLDFPRCDLAAAKCFMHRNTFRHRLRQAEEVLGARLEDPDARLAVHVALKLRRLLATRSAARPLPPATSALAPDRGRLPSRRRTSSISRRPE